MWSAIWPGVGHMVVHARRSAGWVLAALINLVATVVTLKLAWPVRNRAGLVKILADRQTFAGLGLGLVAMALTRLYCVIDASWQARPIVGSGKKAAATFTTAVFVVIGVGPLALGADYVRRTDETIERVFGNGDAITAGSLFEGLGRVNVLLLGGDAGPGRYSLRTDSMIVVSIDPASGDTAMISVPRNTPVLPFPPDTPMGQLFPNGFEDIANAVYPYVDARRELGGGGDDAAAQVMKQGIAQYLGIPINYYVLVDMAGFVHIVDALGGIDLYVGKRVPGPSNPLDSPDLAPLYFEVGQQHMNGTLALSYARSRSADSDNSRIARQRCVLGAIASAATPMSLALGLPDLLSAFGDAMRTDIPRDQLGEFATLIERFDSKGGMSTVRTLHLAPPDFDPTAWRKQQVYDLVANVIAPGSVPFVHPDGNAPSPDATTPPPVPEVLGVECQASA